MRVRRDNARENARKETKPAPGLPQEKSAPRKPQGHGSRPPFYQPTRAKHAKNGLKARSQRGSFAVNWWAKRWIAALERLVDSGRLSRGRTYARKGQVLSIEETGEGIAARVQGSRNAPYKIKIQITPLSAAQWDQVIDAMAEQALFTAQLLAGEMPQEIESVFETAEVSLFPSRRNDLITDCSCPDYSNPCKHIAATHYILGERFDEDPFLIFRLRGRTQEQVLEALRQRRAGDAQVAEEQVEEIETLTPLEDHMEHFWEFGAPLDGFSVSIHAPAIEMPLLKRLGEASFVPAPGLEALLQAAYQTISKKAVEAAFQDSDENR